MRNPLRQVFDFRKRELPVIILLFLFFFLVIAVFQILRPLKAGLFVERYGAEMELYAKLLNIGAAALAVTVFTFLYNRLRRQWLISVLSAFFIVSFLVLVGALQNPGAVSVWGFYALGDLVTTLMVASFFAFLTDVSTPEQAKRVFGPIVGGGVLGGWLGSAIARTLLREIGMEGLLVMAACLMATVTAITFAAEALIARSGVFRPATGPRLVEKQRPKANAALEGARLVMRSPYLAAIVGILGFYEIASQLMDYQFKNAVEALSGVTQTQAFLSDVYFYANLLAVVVQLFLVSLIMRKLGVTAALLILPLAILGSSLAFLMVPTLYVASALVISENGLNYSLQQTARESLYVVTTPDEKYKARAFTNMFVHRLAKGAAIFVVIGLIHLSIPVRYLSLVTVVVMSLMIFCSIFAGRRFREKSLVEEAQVKAA